MPEPIAAETPATVDLTVELETLRRVNTELLAKKEKHKQALTAHETTIAELNARLTAANDTIREIRIGEPLKAMASELSNVPSLFLETFNKHFKVEMGEDGKLAVSGLDGKPLLNGKGEAVTFDRKSLGTYLTESEPASERTKLFRAITITNKASGAIAPSTGHRNTSTPKPSLAQFGLGMK